MAFPVGLTPKTVTIGTATGYDGTLIPDTAYVLITAPYDVVWQPTGDPIFAVALSRKFSSGQVSLPLVPTDLAGLSRVDWTYTATIKIPGRAAIVRHFLLPAAGPSTVDLDALVDVPSSAGTPVSVNVITKPASGSPGKVLTYVDENTTQWADAAGGVTDHGALTGLGDDDHPQYLTQARGDARYQPTGSYATSADLSAASTADRARANHTGTQSADTLTDGTANRLYTSAEKTKLAGIAASATANATNAQLRDRSTHTGTQTADTITDGTTNKAYTGTEQTKLAGIAANATANSTDAQLRDRSTHTGTQAAATITGLATVATSGAYADLSGKPTVGHVVRDEGTALTQRAALNFIGTGVTATDNAGTGATDVTIPGLWGFPATFDPVSSTAGGQIGVAGRTTYIRAIGSGSVSKLALEVTVSAGNIQVSVYRNSGGGRTGTPGTRVATTGVIACPAVGYSEVSLGTTIDITSGDYWFAVGSDNNTTAFRSAISAQVVSDLYIGRAGYAADHPSPATAGALTIGLNRGPLIVGVP